MALFSQGAFQLDPNETPDSIRKKRAMIQQMIMPYGKASNIGEGIAQLFNGISTGAQLRELDKTEKAGVESGRLAAGNIAREVTGNAPLLSGAFPPAPAAPNARQGIASALQGNAPINATGVDVAKRLQDDFGLSPAAAAGFAGNLAHESGNFKTLQEINPTVKGSRGGFGWAQWTGPRRRQYEAWAAQNNLDPTSPEANYGFLKHELTNTPEGAVLKALQGVNDPAQAAQIVSDKFLRPGIPHMGSRVSKSQQIANMLMGKGNDVQVASLDPSIGMSQAYAPAPQPEPATQAVNAMAQGAQQPPPAPQPQQVAQASPQAPQQPAMGIQDAGTPFERMAPQGGMDLNTLIQQAQNPWLDDQSRSFVNGLIQQEMQKRDPAYQQQQQMQQLEMQKAQLELQQMQNPQRKTIEVNGRLVDPSTGEVVYESPAEPVIPKAPTVDTFYDEGTGQPYKGQWNPRTQTWDRVGGSKAGENGVTITNPDGTVTQVGGTGGAKSTEADRRAQLLAKQNVGSAMDAYKNFDEMGSLRNTVGGALTPFGGRLAMTEKGQVTRDAMSNIVKNWLYLVSGATATDEEVQSQVDMTMPSATDKPETIIAKKARMKSIVDTMRERAGMPPLDMDAAQPIAPAQASPSAPNQGGMSLDDLLKKY